MKNIFNTKGKNTEDDYMASLSHTKWNCKYHIVFILWAKKARNRKGIARHM